MEQVRGRVRLLALLLLVVFSVDPLVYFSMWAIAPVAGYPVILGQLGFRLLDLGAVACRGGRGRSTGQSCGPERARDWWSKHQPVPV
ncbi:MAG: hypothetical protein ABI703_05660 [Gemmatimonadales bacterium]